MTCIVGIEYDGKVLIGGDSAMSSGWFQESVEGKVFRVGETVIGLSGSPRMAQLLQYKMTLPPIATEDIARYMATDFVDAVRSVASEGGYAEKENEKERSGSTFLVGIRGQLFGVYGQFDATRTLHGFGSVGSGRQLAMGALHATSGLRWTPRKRLTHALAAAAAFDSGVGPPFHFLGTR